MRAAMISILKAPIGMIILINLVYNKFRQSFPLVKPSLKRAKDKPWITKCLKIDTKENIAYIDYL